MKQIREKGSFRDPSGFLYFQDKELFRQVNSCYKEDYNRLMESGLYAALIQEGFLIEHEEVENPNESAYKTLKPRRIPVISYPYEWSFSQLKDASLLTLEIAIQSLKHNMMLKDASAYNVQFQGSHPVFIDTLSFEEYREGEPWVAYKQFCQHFLAPLLLMHYTDLRLKQLQKIYIDGIPLDLASTLLPFRTRFSPSILAHIHLHARSQKQYSDKTIDKRKYKMSQFQMNAMLDQLKSMIKKLENKKQQTEWAHYYDATNYTDEAAKQKYKLIESYIKDLPIQSAWDLGANNGHYSRILSSCDICTCAFDIDPNAVEYNYLKGKKNKETHLLPLELDLTNPSPAIGWNLQERKSFSQRGPVDLIMALALIHHLAISNNVPLSELASFFSDHCKYLIIEFVPKGDSQVQKLLSTRKDIFEHYHQDGFEKAFQEQFTIINKNNINESERTLYLLRKK